VRVGPQIVTDPAFLVTRLVGIPFLSSTVLLYLLLFHDLIFLSQTRSFEDFVTWVDSSRVKEKLLKYNDQLDDFTLLGN